MPVPDSTVTLAAFLFFIAPGLLFETLYERRRPAREETTFREVSRVVLASIGLSGAAIAVLLVVRLIAPNAVADPESLSRDSTGYTNAHFDLVVTSAVLVLLISLLGAWLWHLAQVKRAGGGTIQPSDPWFEVLRKSAPNGEVPYVRVRVDGDHVYEGSVVGVTYNHDPARRAIVLGRPLSVKPPNETRRMIPGPYQRVVLTGSEVKALTVAYFPKGHWSGTSALTDHDSSGHIQ